MSTPLSDLKQVEVADVYKGEDLAGQLIRTRAGARFIYHPLYRQAGLSPLATHFPLNDQLADTGEGDSGGALVPFFVNLLPEGVRLTAIKNELKTSVDDFFSLLLAVGRDCIGDVSIVPEGEDPFAYHDAAERLQVDKLDFDELLVRVEEGLDKSGIPGVQEKVSSRRVTLPSVRFGKPSIIKLGPRDLPRLVENEHFFLDLAKRCRIPVPDNRLISDEHGRSALVMERFDRVKVGSEFERRAQEDGCQLLNIYPGDKYRVSMRDLLRTMASVCSAPEIAVRDALRQITFSIAIGNGDMHAKNLSVLAKSPDEYTLSPGYDLLSTLPYRNLKQNFALKIDGRDNNFKGKHLLPMFTFLGLPARLVQKEIETLVERLIPQLERLPEIGFDEQTTERLHKEITQRSERLLIF